jgi:hypothetical protein
MNHIKKYNESTQIYSNVKLFNWKDIPYTALHNLAMDLIGNNALDYAAFKYEIGSFVGEFTNAHESDKKHYNPKEIESHKQIDNWFISKGCQKKFL